MFASLLVWFHQATQPELVTRFADVVQYVTGAGVVALIVFAINVRERLVKIETLLSGNIKETESLKIDVRRLERRHGGEEVDS